MVGLVSDASPIGDERLSEIRDIVEEHLRRVLTVLPAGVRPAPGSLAEHQVKSSEVGSEGPWGEEPTWTYLSLVGLTLGVAADHLVGLVQLLKPPLLRHAPTAVGRASIECSAKAYWFLDPTLSLRQRVARGLDEQVRSAEEARGTIPFFGEEHGINFDQTDEQLAEVRRVLDLPPRAAHVTTTALVGQVLEQHTSSNDGGRGLYKYFSALAHGTLYAMLERLQVTDEETGSPFLGAMSPAMNMAAVEVLAFASVMAHAEAIDRAVIYCGGNIEAWRTWSRKAGQSLTPRTG
jgi:hypothetical protein